MRAPRRPVDLSRFVRALGRDVRRHLDTSPGYPTHHSIGPAELRKVRRLLKSQRAGDRTDAIATLRRRILGRDPGALPSPRT